MGAGQCEGSFVTAARQLFLYKIMNLDKRDVASLELQRNIICSYGGVLIIL